VTALRWSAIVAAGPDARSFVDGQVSQDLPSGNDGRWGLLLEPDGSALGALWLTATDDQVRLVVPESLADASLTRLRRFKLRVRCDFIVEADAVGPLNDEADLFDRLWPFDAEFGRGLAPHTYGTEFVATTVSFTKGCFTGQELVARLDVRGANVPFRFVRATGTSLEEIDARLAIGPEGPSGVTRWRVSEGAIQALGFAHRRALEPNNDGVTLEIAR
jgi:folate-binding protein YgfZ